MNWLDLSDHLTVSYPIGLCCGDIATFPDLSSYFGVYDVIVTDRHDDQNKQKKDQSYNKL